MLPVVKGDAETYRQIELYSFALVALTLAMPFLRSGGLVYVLVALALGAVFVQKAMRARRKGTSGSRAICSVTRSFICSQSSSASSRTRSSASHPLGGYVKRPSNAILGGGLALTVVVMFSFAYANVPLFKLFCARFGLGGAGKAAWKGAEVPAMSSSTGPIESRDISVRFMGVTASGLPVRFAPSTPMVTVNPGVLST